MRSGGRRYGSKYALDSFYQKAKRFEFPSEKEYFKFPQECERDKRCFLAGEAGSLRELIRSTQRNKLARACP